MPFFLPVFAFAAAIGAGGFLLGLDVFATRPVHPVDALFLATSAVCVTGLAPFDIFAVYTRPGQCVVLALVQLGGIGIFTYATLFVHLMGRRISLTDRVAVEQGLFYDHGFSLSAFVRRVVALVFVIESAGALCLLALGEEEIGLFNAVFLSVSAFCNAGFAPWGDSLERFRGAPGLNGIIMALIVLGGLGFFVLDDLLRRLRHALGRHFGPARRLPQPENAAPRLSWCSRLVLRTTFWLIVAGGLGIFALEWRNPAFAGMPVHERLLSAFFEAVTCRTAGFDTVNQASFSTASLLFAVLLMGIGGSLYNNITGYFSDILSYSRLMALMLAGAVTAQVFNQLGAMTGNIFTFILISLVGNAINFGLNLLGCYVHDMRLQCLEFFGRFYEDGGKKFTPLQMDTKYYDIVKE